MNSKRCVLYSDWPHMRRRALKDFFSPNIYINYEYRYSMHIVAKSFIIMTAFPVYARSIAYLSLGSGLCSFGFCVLHICSLIASYRMSAEISCLDLTVNSYGRERGGLVVNASDSGSRGRGSSPARVKR